MLVHFTIYDVKHNPPKIMKYSMENCVFSIFMGFQTANKNVFHRVVRTLAKPTHRGTKVVVLLSRHL